MLEGRLSAGPRKACERRRRTDAAMKAGETFDGAPGEAREGGDRRGPERALPLGWRTGRTVKIKAGLARRPLRKLLPRPVPDLTGRRWEKSQRRLSFWAAPSPAFRCGLDRTSVCP
ncbi:hypothetical protein MPLB_1540056 [Mesorhizobium sp. ORS 3324]|nr:hypothetical protein MPLB_1540056 [Mesorhizobium sp. ORS 3324]